jgi:hypothetical protein
MTSKRPQSASPGRGIRLLACAGCVVFVAGVVVAATAKSGHWTANGVIYCVFGILMVVPFAWSTLGLGRTPDRPMRAAQPRQPLPCTRGWVANVPFGAGPLTARTQARFEGFRGHCDCGWHGPSREEFRQAQTDVYQHNGAYVDGPAGWDRW